MMERSLAVAGLILVLVTTVARAEAPGGDHVRTARELIGQQRFPEAAAEFELAYQQSKDPALLYEMATAHRLGGNKAKALELYQRYLAIAPDGAKSKLAYDWIEALTTGAPTVRRAPEVRKPEPRAPEPQPPEVSAEDAERLRQEAALRQQEAALRQQQAEAQRQADADRRQADANQRQADAEQREAARAAWEAAHPDQVQRFHARRKRLRTTGLIIGGIGLAALGTGIVFGVIASGQEDEVSSATRWSADLQDTDEAGQTNGTISVIGISVGAAAVVTGGILYLLGARGGRVPMEGSARLVPAVTQHAGGLTLWGQF